MSKKQPENYLINQFLVKKAYTLNLHCFFACKNDMLKNNETIRHYEGDNL